MKDAMIDIAKFNQLQNQKLLRLLDGLTYDMVMKGMFIANFIRGAICQVLKAEYGISSDLISGALLS